MNEPARQQMQGLTIHDLMRPPTPPASKSPPTGKGEAPPSKPFQEALEEGQRKPLPKEYTDEKTWPALTPEQQHQPQRSPRRDRPPQVGPVMPPGHFATVQAQQRDERLREE